MKKVVSLKVIILSMLTLVVIGVNAKAFATDGVFETNSTAATTNANTTTATEITVDDYTNAATTTNNTTANTLNTTNTSEGLNSSVAYETVDEDDKDLPQTGIEDHYIGIILIVCVAASIYTYKKMRDYKNV